MDSVNKMLSKFRKMYSHRFLFRCAVFAAAAVLFFVAPEQYDVMDDWNFFGGFSFFHVMWLLWVADMVLQLVPCRKYLPLGSQKLFSRNFRPLELISPQKLLNYIKKCNRDTMIVGGVWFLLTTSIGVLYFTKLITRNMLLLITMAFYVSDLVCVLFWCPFRVFFMKNRCCTTCRIFNWDHMMMFSPLVFVPGFYTWSLCLGGFAVFAVWEISFALHPERFWEGSNDALKCSNCTDRLCGGQRCRADVPSPDDEDDE